jgi:hypothetical protein
MDIFGIAKHKQGNSALSASEQQALANRQAEAREAIAACKREGRIPTPARPPVP